MHGNTRLFYRPLHIRTWLQPGVPGKAKPWSATLHQLRFTCRCDDGQLQGPISCVLCLVLVYHVHRVQYSPFTHSLQESINQSTHQSINQSCSVHDRRPQTRQQRRPHWWLWRERRRRERDDLLSVRLAPHAIQSLITTRTSNCDYSFLLYTSVYTIHHTSVFANSPGHARHPLNKHD
jgi:hypothetical protein